MAESNACCATDLNTIASATRHSFSVTGGSMEPNECCVADAFDSTEPPQRCASVRMSSFLFPDNQLRQNTRLRVPTTYVESLSAGTESESVAGVESSSPPAPCSRSAGGGRSVRPQPHQTRPQPHRRSHAAAAIPLKPHALSLVVTCSRTTTPAGSDRSGVDLPDRRHTNRHSTISSLWRVGTGCVVPDLGGGSRSPPAACLLR